MLLPHWLSPQALHSRDAIMATCACQLECARLFHTAPSGLGNLSHAAGAPSAKVFEAHHSLARTSLADAVQANGLGAWLCLST